MRREGQAAFLHLSKGEELLDGEMAGVGGDKIKKLGFLAVVPKVFERREMF